MLVPGTPLLTTLLMSGAVEPCIRRPELSAGPRPPPPVRPWQYAQLLRNVALPSARSASVWQIAADEQSKSTAAILIGEISYSIRSTHRNLFASSYGASGTSPSNCREAQSQRAPGVFRRRLRARHAARRESKRLRHRDGSAARGSDDAVSGVRFGRRAFRRRAGARGGRASGSGYVSQ